MQKILSRKSLYSWRLRLLWIGLTLLLVFIFLFLKIVPGGRIVYVKDYTRKLNFGQGFIYNFTPLDRINEEYSLPRLTGDPVYFSVFSPRTFDRAKLNIYYRRHLSDDKPIIEAGVLADAVVWRYKLKPLENRIIDNLKSSWHQLNFEDGVILQLEKNYQNSEEFLNDLLDMNLKDCQRSTLNECLASYNYNIPISTLPNLVSSETSVSIDVPLRGAHSFFVHANRPLSLDFAFVDLNLDGKNDPVTVIISENDKEVLNRSLDDEREDKEGESIEKTLSLNLDQDFKAGVYKVDVKISDDVVIKSIDSSTNNLVFIRKIWPVSWPKQITLYTDADFLYAKALGPASLQTFNFDNQEFEINQPYEKLEFSLNEDKGGIKKIVLEKDDIILENTGVFSFSSEAFFNPQFLKVDDRFEIKKDVKYIIADYKGAEKLEGGLLKGSASFDLHGVYREKGKYNFLISVPGLGSEDDGDYLEIEKIEVEFEGRSLFQKIFNW